MFRKMGLAVAAAALASACGPTALPTPGGGSPTGQPTPSATPAREGELIIADRSEVRLAHLNAVDVASVPGKFIGVTAGQAIVLDGRTLKSIAYSGEVTTIGTLAETPSDLTMVAVSPDLKRWIYVTPASTDYVSTDSLTAVVHLGSAAGDNVIATLGSPDVNGIFSPFVWNDSGTYLVLNATGIGGVGSFLEYHFPLYKLNLDTGATTAITPSCVAYAVLNEGTLVCSDKPSRFQGSGIDVRFPDGTHETTAVATSGVEMADVVVSPDGKRVAAVRNGGTDSAAYYQTVVMETHSGVLTVFGAKDFVPNVWLADGRLVETYACINPGLGGAPCDSSKAGNTIILSADGLSSIPFFDFAATSARVVGALS